MGAFNLIGPAMQGTRVLGGLKNLLLGGGPVGGAVSLGVGFAPKFNKAAQDNPTRSARMSVLGSMGNNLAGSSAVRAPSRKTEGYTSYGTYKVGDIEYDMASGRPLYMPAGSVYPSNSVAPFVPAAAFKSESKTTPASVLDPYAAQNRAYQQERARVEAMVKANPDMQKQEIADARAKVRDQGMAIWQQKYGGTPMAQPGGAVGMDNPLMQQTFGYQTGSAPDQQMGAPTLGPSPLVPQVDQSLNPASPNFIGGEGRPLMNFADPRFENMSPEDFQKLLNQVNKK